MNPYREILDLFVSKDELRPEMCKPFRQEDWAIATDGHSLVKIPFSLLGEKSDVNFNDKAPNALSVIPEPNRSDFFDALDLFGSIYEAKKEFAKIYKVEEIECPDCKGTGMATFQLVGSDHETYFIDSECPVCEEMGCYEQVTHIPTGKIMKEEVYAVVEIEGVYFNANLIARIDSVAEILNERKVKRIYCDKTPESGVRKAQLFRIGEVEMLFMPLAQTAKSENNIITVFKI